MFLYTALGNILMLLSTISGFIRFKAIQST